MNMNPISAVLILAGAGSATASSAAPNHKLKTHIFPSSPMRSNLLLLVTILATFAAAAADETATFTLYDNGSSQNGVEVTLAASEFAELSSGGDADDAPPGEGFAMAMSTKIEVSKYRAPKPVLATRGFREDGELITEFDQLKPASEDADGALRRVYLVADGLEFVWPFVELGHRQVVSARVVPPTPAGPLVLESVGESPRVFQVHNIASEEEANAIITTALNATGENALKRSTVGSGTDDEGNDLAKEDHGRTSHNSWDHESPAAKVMIARSFQLTNIKEDPGKRDGLQVVRYTPGQGYNTHPDYFTAKDEGSKDFDFYPYSGGSNRFATVFMYLNDPEEGGYTVFPRAAGTEPEKEMPPDAVDMFKKGTWENTVNDQCYTKLAVPPKLGTAALFYSITPDGQIDPMSHHAACPLIRGTKWGANIWIWNKQRYGDIRTGDPRSVLMRNAADETVYISWEGRDNGVIEPGKSMNMNSFEYHRFKASFNSHKDKSIAEFTVQSEPAEEAQLWEIKRPRHYQHSLDEPSSEDMMKKIVVEARNTLDSPVDIVWQGKPLWPIQPGGSSNINTFFGHEFEAAVDDEVLSKYNVKASPIQQSWIITDESGVMFDSEEKKEEDIRDEL